MCVYIYTYVLNSSQKHLMDAVGKEQAELSGRLKTHFSVIAVPFQMKKSITS